MKLKFFSFIVLCFCGNMLLAQIDTLCSRNKLFYKKWHIALNLNTIEPVSDAGFDYNALSQRIFTNGRRKEHSYSLGCNINYNIKDNCTLRLTTRITNYKVTETRDFRDFFPEPQVGGVYELSNLDIKQTMYAFVPAIMYSMDYKQLNFYGGLQLAYRKYTSITGNTTYAIYEYPSNNLKSSNTSSQTEPGGFSIGVGPVIGMYLKPFKHIGIGTEISTTYSYYKTGGDITTYQTLVVPQTPSYYYGLASISNQTFRGYRVSSMLASINILIFL